MGGGGSLQNNFFQNGLKIRGVRGGGQGSPGSVTGSWVISRFQQFLDCVFQQVKSTIVDPPCANTSHQGPPS